MSQILNTYSKEEQELMDKYMEFYVDPCYSPDGILSTECEAIFTYNNIPRELIEDDCMYFEVKK